MSFDPLAIGDLVDNSWLWPILGHAESPLLPDSYNGETEAARQRQTLEVWVEFISNRRQAFIGVLGFLSMVAGEYRSAINHLEKLLLIAREYELLEPYRPQLVLPRVLLGDCYRETSAIENARRIRRRAASLRSCLLGAEHDDFTQCGLPWIEKAESRLLADGQTLPAPDVISRAAGHLHQAMSYLLAAEQFEVKGEDLTDRVRRAGSRYCEFAIQPLRHHAPPSFCPEPATETAALNSESASADHDLLIPIQIP